MVQLVIPVRAPDKRAVEDNSKFFFLSKKHML